MTCSACQTRKQIGTHHPHKNIMMTESMYCFVIVDDYTLFIWVFFLQEKFETQGTLKIFLRRAQNVFNLSIEI
jgi:hypothetical protein